MSKKTITQNNLPSFWDRVTAYINDRLPKGALASKDIATIEDGGTNATTAKDARVNLGITYGTEVPTKAPVTGSGAIYFFEDDYTPVSIPEGGTGANTAEGALENLGIGDWIVETGTEGIWTWRKWNSGLAECWGTHVESGIMNTSWGSLYTCQLNSQVAYPFTFVERPKEFATAHPDSGACWIYSESGGNGLNTTTHSAKYSVARPSSTTSASTLSVDIKVVGKWK